MDFEEFRVIKIEALLVGDMAHTYLFVSIFHVYQQNTHSMAIWALAQLSA